VALHPLAEQFASVAGAYERGRPDYAPAVVGALAASSEAQRTETLARAAAIGEAGEMPAELSVQTVIGLTSPA
jgi:hypothetical protein